MIGIGIIGCGGMGTDLIRKMVKAEGAELVATFDANPEAAVRLADEMGAEACGSYKEMLARPQIDAVVVATPGYLHTGPVVQAAGEGKHVFCEKPLALTLEDCDMMIQSCREAGVNLMVGQVLRLIPIFKESARIVREELGKPVAMSTMRIGGWGYSSGWRSRIDQCGGVLLEVNAHEFDYLRHICGEPREAFGYGGRFVLDYVDFEDTVFSSFKFEGGAIGLLRSGGSSTMGRYTGEIICKGGALFFDNNAGTISYKAVGDEEVTLTRDDLPPNTAVAEETAEFISSIEENRRPAITGEDGRAAVEMALAIRQSIAEGRPIPIGKR
jgi:myo-inositol 2-dehydrogenase/D-chiro-inositol 1-dehydrogenase